MNETTIAEYWTQAQICSARADSPKAHASKQLWMQMAQDWVALADRLESQSGQQATTAERTKLLEPFHAV